MKSMLTWKIIRKHEIVYRMCSENDLVNDFTQSVCAKKSVWYSDNRIDFDAGANHLGWITNEKEKILKLRFWKSFNFFKIRKTTPVWQQILDLRRLLPGKI